MKVEHGENQKNTALVTSLTEFVDLSVYLLVKNHINIDKINALHIVWGVLCQQNIVRHKIYIHICIVVMLDFFFFIVYNRCMIKVEMTTYLRVS